jgi:glycine/D-amino acid oxidase-like deaminating enzyme
VIPRTDTRDVFAEDFSHSPYWWRHAAPLETTALEVPEHTDALIIGSGYAGLSCAIELARAGRDVTVVDTNDIGSGASSRAAGFVSGRAGVSKQIDLEAVVGKERAKAILEEADEAYEHLQNVIQAEGIDCDFQPVGRFVGAHTPAAFEKIAKKMKEYDSDGRNRFEMIARGDQERFVRSDFFHGGMLIKDAGSVHPAKYHAGLLRICREAGVRLVGQTRVQGIVDEAAGKSVYTTRGVVVAREVMLGTGGYTDGASPWHRKRIIPMSSTIIATEYLGKERVNRLFPSNCPVIDTKRVISFARPTPDGQHILFGGRARFTPVGPEESVRILHGQMRQVFPDLHDVKVINAWSGFMAFTFDFLPKVGVQDGLHYAIACNGGAGIVMMSWLGRKAAWNILGTANRDSAFAGLPFKTQPFYSGNPWFVPILGSWYRFRDWLELRQMRA